MSEQGFRGLLVWQRAKTLAVAVYGLTKDERLKRDFSLADQLRRSAVSVASNIAEGDERESNRDSIRFFLIAEGSLAELATQLEIAQAVGCLTREQTQPLLSQTIELGKMLGALIRARNRPRDATRPEPRA